MGLVVGAVVVDEKSVSKNAGVREGSTVEVKDGKAILLLRKVAAFNLHFGRARATTLGVRGTKIYIDAPKDQSKAIQFFTLKGKAEVMPRAGALPISVNQNQGLSTRGLSQKSSNETTAASLSSLPHFCNASTGICN